MSMPVLSWLIVVPTVAVVIVLFALMWRQRSSVRTAWVAGVSGIVLAAWGIGTGLLASRGFYRPRGPDSVVMIGVQLAISLVVLASALWFSPSFRSLLADQKNLIRLNLWRLVGAVFLALMVTGQVPALWALPAGLGDVLIGAWAFPVARRLAEPGGRRRAVIFNLLGLLDLVVAVGLGTTTSPGALQLFHPTPTGELLARFPLALVPGFLVPLAVAVHGASLAQLWGPTWKSGKQRGT